MFNVHIACVETADVVCKIKTKHPLTVLCFNLRKLLAMKCCTMLEQQHCRVVVKGTVRRVVFWIGQWLIHFGNFE